MEFIKNLFRQKKQNWIIWVLIIIIVLGFGIRIYQLGTQSYWIDEGFTLNAVMSTLEKGFPILDSGYKYTRSILNTYLIAGSVSIFGFNPWAARLVSVLFGSAMIWLIFALAKKLFNNPRIALAASFLTAFSYLQIAWSRQARMYIQFEFFFFLSLYLFYLLLEKHSLKRLIFVILSTIAAILSHEFGFLLIGVYIFGWIAYNYGPFSSSLIDKLKAKTSSEKFLTKYFWAIFGVLVIIIPLAGIKLYEMFLSRAVSLFIEDTHSQELFIGGDYIHWLFKLNPLIVILAVVGLVWYIFKNKNLFQPLYLFIALVMPFYVIISSTDLFHMRYLMFFYPLLFIFVAMFFVYFVDLIMKPKKIRKFSAYILVGLLLVFAIFNANFTMMPTSLWWIGMGSPQPNFSAAYEAVETLGFDENDVIISPYTAMDKVYLGQSDYWFPVSLSGHLSEIKNRKKSLYNNSERIELFEDLKLLEDQKAYFVFDLMALNRMGHQYLDFLQTHYKLRFTAPGVWVFRVDKNN